MSAAKRSLEDTRARIQTVARTLADLGGGDEADSSPQSSMIYKKVASQKRKEVADWFGKIWGISIPNC